LTLSEKIFHITSEQEFNAVALEMFQFQYQNNKLYQQYCDLIKVNMEEVEKVSQIPFLPISFFKSHQIKTTVFKEEIVFLSSGTTGANQSQHFVKDLALYETSFFKAFEHFYGDINDFCILALLPSYMEREGSSLIFMMEHIISKNGHPKSGFYLKELDNLIQLLKELGKQKQKTLLFGVSFALLDLAEVYEVDLSHVIIMETGGMKGRRKELTRSELHQIYKDNFKLEQIHSEYGMTELLSQAYSKGNGIFKTPSWMKILIRDINDPFSYLQSAKSGGINVIDLANIYSCSFIATQDLGKAHVNGSFEVLGRFDNSDLRGCNLLID
jgi:phenylacetate-coenzyme A ligase PaaK-like adenylate-forming protein